MAKHFFKHKNVRRIVYNDYGTSVPDWDKHLIESTHSF